MSSPIKIIAGQLTIEIAKNISKHPMELPMTDHILIDKITHCMNARIAALNQSRRG